MTMPCLACHENPKQNERISEVSTAYVRDRQKDVLQHGHESGLISNVRLNITVETQESRGRSYGGQDGGLHIAVCNKTY